MSKVWKRTFDLRLPLDTVWGAFTDAEFLGKLFAVPEGAQDHLPEGETGATQPKVLEVRDHEFLRWTQNHPRMPEKSEFSCTFEEQEGGSRVTITRSGFGEGELSELFAKSHATGWSHGFQDMILALETGVFAHRHYNGVSKSSLGVSYAETPAGLEVCEVLPGTFGEAVGLARGDVLVRLADAPLFARTDLWTLLCAFEAGRETEIEWVHEGELRRAQAPLSAVALRAVGE